MKHLVPFLSAAVLVTACNSNPKTESQATQAPPVTMAADTAGLAQFQAWKAQHELATVAQYTPQAVATAAPVHKAVRTSTAARRSAPSRPTSTESGTMTSESENTAKAPEKRGWSKAAKGAAIGAGVGAAAGAVINKKNRVVGGVIGGAAGGAVGYGIGRHMDKRDGRY
jgi:hypothetical protein